VGRKGGEAVKLTAQTFALLESADDDELLAGLRDPLVLEEVCRWYGVPPRLLVGDPEPDLIVEK
jgi:hypothetical protein